jgi:hypothetical protein
MTRKKLSEIRCLNNEICKYPEKMKGKKVCGNVGKVIEWTANYPYVAGGYVCRNCGYAWSKIVYHKSFGKGNTTGEAPEDMKEFSDIDEETNKVIDEDIKNQKKWT